MRSNRSLQGFCAVALWLTLGTSSFTAAAGPDTSVTDAKIEAGRLVVAGKASMPGMKLRLDKKQGDGFSVTAGSDRSFRFSLVYLPRDCVVDVQRIMPNGSLGAANSLVIANCAPAGLSPRGAWSAKLAYDANDLVSFKGSSWLATRESINEQPDAGGDWQLFAEKGQPGGGETAAQTLGLMPQPSGPSGDLNIAATASAASSKLASALAVPSGSAGGDLAGTYPNPEIAAGAVVAGKIRNQAVTSQKLRDGAVTTVKIADTAVNETKIADGAVTGAKILDDSIQAEDIGNDAIGFAEIQTDAVQATEIADNSIDSGEIVDFGLSNQDIGVLFAEVSAAGAVENSSGGVTAVKLSGAGTYEVDFGRDITFCTSVATVGPSGAGSAVGEVNVADRSGNSEAVFVDTNDSNGTAADKPFRLVLVC